MTDRFHCYTRSLQSSPAEISDAVAWVKGLAVCHGMGEDALFRLDLCVSELLDNVAEHGYGDAVRDIRMDALLDRDSVTVRVEDSGPAFDPQTYVPRPLPHSLMEAEIGGLGVRLVRQFADSLVYERRDDRNQLTLRIGVPPASAPANIGDASLFRGVAAEQVDAIVARCELRTCGKDEILFRKGAHHRCVLVNLEGVLHVHLDEPDSTFFLELAPGESVGELSVADGNPVSAWVIAATPCRLLVIPEWVFLETVLAVPQIARNLIVSMSERMRRSDAHVLARVKATLELEALQRELDFARQIQSSMLPVAPLFAGVRGVEGRGFMRAARHVGGDFYDAISLTASRAFVAIGDVCGKGTPAALFMVRTLMLLRSEALNADPDTERHLARLVTHCNEILNESNEAQLFATLFCAIIDVERDSMCYVNAGHSPALLRAPSGETTLLSEPRNPLVGIVPGLEFSVGRCDFRPGSLCVLYTDGVTEAENSAGALFSDGALHAIVSRAEVVEFDRCVDSIVAAVDGFAEGQPQADDITLLAIRRIP
jgi:serine phosphatase RsbU (regulator of sigma subunit)/anti-sigma regulatory factor (Ser/Thr protein kinase)